ncbi:MULTISPECIES: WhiB family transcriptional regulator [Bifidobacterium]|uniref:WhiB family transcriptional regulator n=2 Tax=Bifidobacterium TaxID=1678 RepID=A0A261FP23_9BIFI|nr:MULTISPECIES: WhiB family transcriptional regulator [Bifidobacterium]OZG60735.1 WhiB family transcriptional regulator [Bifidobacterium lemurum]OZG69633.1 WhiB family transcriptional regulator [Bifidobacterium eulemuris]QOL32253.1 WhiB family transcriptional regulator [Bifidobacterium eulemuris]QOL35213.1 WhiB family transcriptional regulator [Bifidobacterium lemurum]
MSGIGVCAQIAAKDPERADRMWGMVLGEDGEYSLDRPARAMGRQLCDQCPLRVDCLSRALVSPVRDNTIIGGLSYEERTILARRVAKAFDTASRRIHKLSQPAVRDWLAGHPEIIICAKDARHQMWRQKKQRREPVSAQGTLF